MAKHPINLPWDWLRDNTAKSWLFEKYYNMCFADMNPEGDAEADPLEDEEEWEYRIIRNIVWRRHKGYVVETALHGTPEIQSIETYRINTSLHHMIIESPHNVRPLFSQIENNDDNDSDSDSD